jgi:hypothetical protein
MTNITSAVNPVLAHDASNHPPRGNRTRLRTATSAGALAGPKYQRVALTTGATQRRNAVPRAPASQLESRVQRDPGARHDDRMPDGDRTAVNVDDFGINAQFPCCGLCLC